MPYNLNLVTCVQKTYKYIPAFRRQNFASIHTCIPVSIYSSNPFFGARSCRDVNINLEARLDAALSFFSCTILYVHNIYIYIYIYSTSINLLVKSKKSLLQLNLIIKFIKEKHGLHRAHSIEFQSHWPMFSSYKNIQEKGTCYPE